MPETRAILRTIEGGLDAKCPREYWRVQQKSVQHQALAVYHRLVIANIYWLEK